MNTKTIANWLNRYFCPWANQYVYWLKTPLGILVVAALASLLCGLLVAPQGLVIAATIAATIVLGMLWPWLGLRGLCCELSFPQQRGVEGQASQVEVIVRNRWPFPVWGLAIENGFFLDGQSEDGTAVALSGIRGWSMTRFKWNFLPACRGTYPTTSPKLTTEFPFGVWKARRDIESNGRLTVWPSTINLETAAFAGGPNRSTLRSSDTCAGNEGDRIGVRAYRNGDSLRLVHWPQTAKSGRLIVSERQGAAQSTAVIAIDSDPKIAHGFGSDSSFESSIRIAASLCEQLIRQNVRVVMVANRESWDVQPSELSRRRSLDRLAILDNSQPLDLTHCPRHAEQFVITTSTQSFNWGPRWKSVVLDNSIHSPPDLKDGSQRGWILIDDSAEPPFHQFARHWKRTTTRAWRGSRRKLGVA